MFVLIRLWVTARFRWIRVTLCTIPLSRHGPRQMCSALTSELQLLVSTMIMPLLGLVPAMRRALVLLPISCTQAPRPVSKPSQVMVRATTYSSPA